MTSREHRRYSNTPEEKERLTRKACPVCGRGRSEFPAGWDAICCGPSCSSLYWREEHPTVGEMRRLVLLEQEGKCARCRKEIPASRAAGGRHQLHPFILDHIRPIAMGGDQWAPGNLQVLCARCNRIKTARDMGAIARWKRYEQRGQARPEDRSWLGQGAGGPAVADSMQPGERPCSTLREPLTAGPVPDFKTETGFPKKFPIRASRLIGTFHCFIRAGVKSIPWGTMDERLPV